MRKLKKYFAVILLSTAAMTVVTGCQKEQNTEKVESNKDEKGTDTDTIEDSKVVVTVNDSKIPLSEALYYVLIMEQQYDQYDQMYQMLSGTSYWEMEYEDGILIKDKVKEDTMNIITMYDILYQEALKTITLTEEDTKENESNTESIWNTLTEEQKEVLQTTKEELLELQNKLALAEKYYDKVVEEANIDEEKIKESINYEDYRQYEVQLLCLYKEKEKEDKTKTPLTKKQLDNAKKEMEEMLKKAKSGKKFSNLVKDSKFITTETIQFIKDDGSLVNKLQKQALKLAKDEISPIVETDEGFIAIKMIEDNSTERYDEEVKEAILTAQQEAFNKAYEELKKNYTITVNEKIWSPIVLGKTTINLESETATDSSVNPEDSESSNNSKEEKKTESDN